jgi:tetratricopeptide (TPR) repeat protein
MGFYCGNQSCIIAISDGRFPEVKDCPVCGLPLSNEVQLNEEELTLIRKLPYVIAFPLKQSLEESNPCTKINLFKDTFLNYLKYLGLVTASEFFSSPIKDKRLVALFHSSLAEPSFGSWNKYIRETIAFLQQHSHSFFCPELPTYYEFIETGKKRKLFNGEIKFIDNNGDLQLQKQKASAIDMLINFRNRYLGHGLTPDSIKAQQLWNEYYPILIHLLEQMKFSKDYPMFKTEHGETYRLESDNIQLVEKQTPVHGNVWMENSTGQTLDIIPFFVVPGEVSIAKVDKEQIFTYESYTGKTIKFFSPEGTEKQTSGKILERLNILLHDKQKEQPYNPESFTKAVFLARIAEENKLIYDTLIAEKKVIPGVYINREAMEIKLLEWIGARANIFLLAAEAGSGKTNLLVEMQQRYTNREFPTLLIRAGRMEKSTLTQQLCYLLNIDSNENLGHYSVIAGTHENPTFILLDGLNEAHNADSLWQELFEICEHFEPGGLKFVISCRANTAAEINRFKINPQEESRLYADNDSNQHGLREYSHWLTTLSMEETKKAWENYVKKDRGKFKPLFFFDDIATFDRALYNQINNPLVLRLFLETYHGKNLPKKGKKHLNIWRDWLSSFTPQEQEFFKLLADAIWEKGENELLLDEVLNDTNLKLFFTTDQLNAPYPRLRNLGWISRYVKDLNGCVGFTVEGALLNLFGRKFQNQRPQLELSQIKQYLQSGSKLQQAGVGVYLQHRALEGDLHVVCNLVDSGEEFLDVCMIPIVLHLKTIGVKETLDILLKNPTENDWKILLKVNDTLKKLVLVPQQKAMACIASSFNKYNSKSAILYCLDSYNLLDNTHQNNVRKKIEKVKLGNLGSESFQYFRLGLFYLDNEKYEKAIELFNHSLKIEIKKNGSLSPLIASLYTCIGETWFEKREFDKALEFYQQCLDIRLKILGNQHSEVATAYQRIGHVHRYKFEYDKALEFYQQCLDIRLKTLGNQHPHVAFTCKFIGHVCVLKVEYNKALEFYQEGLDILQKTLGNQHPDIAYFYRDIGFLFERKVEFDKALKFHQQCLDILLKTLGNQHPETADSYFHIGNLQMKLELFQKAIESHKAGFAIKKQGGFPFQIAKCHEKLKELGLALDYYIQSAEIRMHDPKAGPNYSPTKEAISEVIRLSKTLKMEDVLPEWIKVI